MSPPTEINLKGLYCRRLPHVLVAFIFVAAAMLLVGCTTVTPIKLPLAADQSNRMTEVMQRKGLIVHLSEAAVLDKPVLVLLHGATADPSEMMEIARQWRSNYDVFLFSYNYHEPLGKIASEFSREMKRLKEESLPGRAVTVVTYSYAAIVFREAVITAGDRTLFSEDSLIQLVPTAGGSRLACGMQHRLFAVLIGMFSNMSTAEDPYGGVAKRLWEGEGNKKFYEVMKPRRIQTIVIEGDSHSLALVKDKEVQRRYKNGIGDNVIVIPKGAGVVHDYFPTEPAALEYLRKALELLLAQVEPASGSAG